MAMTTGTRRALLGFVLILAGLLGARPAAADRRDRAAGREWHADYSEGLAAEDAGDWNRAAQCFQRALATKDRDTAKTRAYGTIFVAYFPHRELGVCWFQLGDLAKARAELETSISQAASPRARLFLERVNRGDRPSQPGQPAAPPSSAPPSSSTPVVPAVVTPPAVAMPSPEQAPGERFSIAVLPFDSKGIGQDLGSIDLLDKLVAAFVNTNRFKVIERAQLEKILAEQKLGMSGIIDASTAAEIGKGIGVDAVMVGSMTRSGNAVTVDARLIDTETAAIVTARDAFSSSTSLTDLSRMVNDLAAQMKADFPLVSGYVIQVDSEKLTLDLGTRAGLRKGTKCLVYREGKEMIHPVTQEVLAREVDQICEVQITAIFDSYSIARITKTIGAPPGVRDRVITK